MLEVEVKVRCQLKDISEKLLNLDFERGTSVYEKDTYFNGGSLDLKAEDKAVRIREHKDLDTGVVKYVLNYKGPKVDDRTMTREEIQFEIPTFEHGGKVLGGLDFYPAGNVEKTRLHFIKDSITCCLDDVTGLGEFLEIEIMSADRDEYEMAINKIKDLLALLNLSMTDTIRSSYLSMLQDI